MARAIFTRPGCANNADGYSRGDKEPKFEIDGVFLPPEGEVGTVYFCEVQF